MPQDESSTLRQPLPDRWIAKIFQELQGNYGTRFLNQWKTGQQSEDGSDVGVKNAMTTWARKLGGFGDMPDALKSVLESLPSNPPSLPEFVELCRDAARSLAENVKRIERQMTAEEKERADHAAKEVKKIVTNERRDYLGWAKRPVSPIAFETVKQLANEDSAFREILAKHVSDGVCTAEFKLLKVWGNKQWVTA